MKVKYLVLYQVATDRNYKVGDCLEFGKNLNGNGFRVLKSQFNNGKKSYHHIGFDYINNSNIFKNKKLLVNVCKAFSEMDFVLRELAAEEVRKTEFPDCPSRMKCMFLSDTKEKALSNLKEFYKNGKGKIYQAVAVKLNGEVFYAKTVGLERNGLSYEQYCNVARKYWAQNQNAQDEVKEILFEGKAEIVEILAELKN